MFSKKNLVVIASTSTLMSKCSVFFAEGAIVVYCNSYLHNKFFVQYNGFFCKSVKRVCQLKLGQKKIPVDLRFPVALLIPHILL